LHAIILELFVETVDPEEFAGKRVLEVGSKYVNGSVRPFIERYLKPSEYVGVDIEKGKFVEVVLPVEKLTEYFGEESFDVVITTEMLEHVHDWKVAMNNLKRVVKRGGILYCTTRSKGYGIHSHPHDYWRYEIDDMKKIFSDFEVISLLPDLEAPGVFLKAIRPKDGETIALDNLELYSIVLGKKTRNIVDLKDMPKLRKSMNRIMNTRLQSIMPGYLLRYLKKHFSE
jgi:SAM-dependent methyltransferase